MTYKAVIFDLDGTLLDTLDDLAGAVNRVLARRGYPQHDANAYRWFIGDGSEVLMRRALPPEARTVDIITPCLADLLADYHQHWHDLTRPYEGIPELLTDLGERGIVMAVVTNKPHQFTHKMMAHYFAETPFYPVFGQQDHLPKKPDPVQALRAADKMGVAPANCIFLGDSAIDMQTAQRAGMAPVGAGWGFRPVDELRSAGAQVVCDHPSALLTLL
ncbi:MAG: HAD-IA family hydrolase [Desulfatitalea sp.]|nr:HAD-IA family hydrolase [Desulfatitalea sp.]NNJ98962.1 HAD-IA family hydrolase [Desulfatitalea sp.]